MRIFRVLLASLLAVSSIPLRAFSQEEAGDLIDSANPLCRCVAREIAAADAGFAEASSAAKRGMSSRSSAARKRAAA